MQSKMERLLPDQEALVLSYCEKWQEIAFSTEPIDRCKVIETIKLIYLLINRSEPIIHFAASPYAALEAVVKLIELPTCVHDTSQMWESLVNQITKHLGFPLYVDLGNEIILALKSQLQSQLGEELKAYVDARFTYLYESPLNSPHNPTGQMDIQIEKQLSQQFKSQFNLLKFLPDYFFHPYASILGELDFCASVLRLNIDKEKWEALQSLFRDCRWIYPFEKVCFICDRPIKLMLNKNYCLHAVGEPALQFADGYKLYSVDGITQI
jgi:hypothetical protein